MHAPHYRKEGTVSNKEKAQALRQRAAGIEAAAKRSDDYSQYYREMREAQSLRAEADRIDPPKLKSVHYWRCIACKCEAVAGSDGWELVQDRIGVSAALCPEHAGSTSNDLELIAAELRAADNPEWRLYRHGAGILRGLEMPANMPHMHGAWKGGEKMTESEYKWLRYGAVVKYGVFTNVMFHGETKDGRHVIMRDEAGNEKKIYKDLFLKHAMVVQKT